MRETIEKYGDIEIIRENSVIYYVIPKGISRFNEAIDKILLDENIEEIMYNGNNSPIIIYHHRYGMCQTIIPFSDKEASFFAGEAAKFIGKRLDANSPVLDAALPDGNRINATIPPASSFVTITIRKFLKSTKNLLDLIKDGTITADIAAYIWLCTSRISEPSNILFVGGTASGKTTLLDATAMLISPNERIVVIEDTKELKLTQKNVVRMISKEGLTMDSLLQNALRMRPDRILVGEVRGSEAITLFNSMNTGHSGCMGTLHANSARECITRVTNPPMSVPVVMLDGLQLIIVLKKMPDGARKLIEIAEIAGADIDGAKLNIVYSFDPKKNSCIETGIPSRLKSKIAQDSGKNIKEIDALLRIKKETFVAMAKKNAASQELVIEALKF
ncbi:MAG: ATPase, T2SS/T4P/T4SS family [archaeon]